MKESTIGAQSLSEKGKIGALLKVERLIIRVTKTYDAKRATTGD
ncbi:MAG: hypothetical protein Q4G03_03400 [Planctomycetia bacterium]|nr:hypothetical protein [Planctomycetia bacterium]